MSDIPLPVSAQMLRTFVNLRNGSVCKIKQSLQPSVFVTSALQWEHKSLLRIHIRDEIRHGIGDSCESLPMTEPWVGPKVASKKASLVRFPQAQVGSKAACCILSPPGGPLYHFSHASIHLCPGFAPMLP